MLQKVAFTMFAADDAARARAFYEQTLGLAHAESVTFTSRSVIESPIFRMATIEDSEGNSIILHPLR